MKFVHIADMHFDMPFTVLSKNGLAEERRIDQRKAFQKMINYIKENNIEYLLISGDLYEHEYVRKSTIEYINQCFKQIPNNELTPDMLAVRKSFLDKILKIYSLKHGTKEVEEILSNKKRYTDLLSKIKIWENT